MGGWSYDVESKQTTFTDTIYDLYGKKISSLQEGVQFYHPDDKKIVCNAFEEVITHKKPYDLQVRFINAQGDNLFVRTIGKPFIENGKVVKIYGNLINITEHKLAELEQKQLQDQLLQAQKMESVGRLAGGVAHDYNNISSVILGYAELALAKVEQSDPLHDYLKEIRTAVNRSTNITRQLLTFARKQTVAPVVIDPNDAIADMLKMLQRLIGENIEITWIPGDEIRPIKIDPTQMNQLMANLCVNARDAIPDVGKISVETKNINFDEDECAGYKDFVPGEYVQITVSDNGSGMTPETQEKIFDPFFTTKGTGKGTGLGLATVYGIVKQNNGFINVYSEISIGTTFKLDFHA
jgi:signal transduction histidine kinase